MNVYGKSWDYNVYDCRYCLYWKSKKKGCVYPDGCCCPIEQKPPEGNGADQSCYETVKENFLYLDWKNGVITNEEYVRLKGKITEQENLLRKKIKALTGELGQKTGKQEENPCLRALLKDGMLPKLPRTLLLEMIDTIWVHEKGAISIDFKMEDVFKGTRPKSGEGEEEGEAIPVVHIDKAPWVRSGQWGRWVRHLVRLHLEVPWAPWDR